LLSILFAAAELAAKEGRRTMITRRCFIAALILGSARMVCSADDGWFVPLEARTEEKARGIILPSVEIDDIPMLNALRYLEREAKKQDPRHIGIRISTESMEREAAKKWRGEPNRNAIVLARHVTLKTKETTFLEAVRMAAGLNNCILIPTVEGFRVMRNPESIDVIYCYTIPLPKEVFGKKAVPGRFGIDRAEVDQLRTNPKAFFERHGAAFHGNSAATYDETKLTLTLVAPLIDLDFMRDILEAVFKKPGGESVS
jgi:hypothetical protein